MADIEIESATDVVQQESGSAATEPAAQAGAAAQTGPITQTAVTSAEAIALIKNVREMLNEEKWTRATISNYSTAQFKDFDNILKEAQKLKVVSEVKKDCDEHLSHSKNSIIALYISGMVALSRQLIDDAAMTHLVTIFAEHHKWAIVEYLCKSILHYGESRFALRTLSDYYKNENNENEYYDYLKRLVKADMEEAEGAKLLAERAGQNTAKDKKAEAVDYYKKALHRYINKSLYANVKEIWEKLLEVCPEDIDFFLHVQKKVAKNISEEKAIDLLKIVYASCKEKGEIDTAIYIIKTVLEYDEKDYPARKEIIDCYRKKYAGHSRLDDYIQVSNLTQSYRSVYEAIADFEKHIAFDKGNFVFHRTWGVGRIVSINGDEIKIDFAKKRGHTMSLKMAVGALQTLPGDHIWVLKATEKKEKLLERVKKDIPWALRTVIRSFGNSCDIKKIKAELCPSVLSEKEWPSWNSKARELLKSDPVFGVSPDNIDMITVRDRPISVWEKLYNEFRAEKNFFARIATIRRFANLKDAETDSDYFAEMIAYPYSFLKTSNQSGEQAVTAYLFVKELAGGHPHLAANLTLKFADIFKGISDVPGLFSSLKDSRIKEEFLKSVQISVPEWADIFAQLFPRTMIVSIVEQLEKEGYDDKLTAMTVNCFENFRDRREAVIWLFKNSSEKKWFNAANISLERQLIVLIHIIDLTFRNDTIEARKVNKQAHTILFKDGVLGSFIGNADIDTVTRIYNFINEIKSIDSQDKINLNVKIQDRFPDFKFIDTEEKKVSRKLFVTKVKYEEMRRKYANIQEVEIPANSKEIEAARLHGDLKENAEYKAAKEKQVLLNTEAEKLKEGIDRAQIFDPADINTSRVSFGTVIFLKNNTEGKDEEYTMLGPRESDPENHIISYETPFGKAMVGKTAGESFDFVSDGQKNSYTVESIKAANF